MLDVRDITELKKRINIYDNNFTRISGCYVNNEKEQILRFTEKFYNMADEERYKYLEIAKELFSKKVDDNMLDLEFDQESGNGIKQLLLVVREEMLKNENTMDRLYERIIENYDTVGNYLILLYHDIYDVVKIAEDNEKLDKSETVYNYIACAICPVTLTQAGLQYKESENKIGARIRDWVVQKPHAGFIYPAFIKRAEEVDRLMYYTATPAEPKHYFMEAGLECRPVRTKKEIQEAFEKIIYDACESKELKEEYLVSITEMMGDWAVMKESTDGFVTSGKLRELCCQAGVPMVYAERIEEAYGKEYGTDGIRVGQLLNKSYLKKAVEQKKKKKLLKLLCEAAEVIEKNAGEETTLTEEIKAALKKENKTGTC